MPAESVAAAAARPPSRPAFSEAVKTWGRIGLLSFGGPAGQIALMHRVLVDEKKWIGERQFLSALNFCMLLPGPEAMQLATYAGWRLHGAPGGLAAGLLFVLPGALVVLSLSLLYAMAGALPLVTSVFIGIKAAVLAIVIEALLKVSRRALAGVADWATAAAAFVALYAFAAPFPYIIAAAAILGYLRRDAPANDAASSPAAPVSHWETGKTIALWLAIWILPLAGVALAFGPDHVLTRLAWFFSKLAVVTFGGAYALLAYMSQEIAQGYGWLSPGEMLDGLGLAETTPGPLILVTEFVGFLAAYRHGGGEPVLMGLLGALVTLWATFAPCFLWIFAGAPYVERLNANRRLASALRSVTAAVAGVILNLSLWFALHVLFREVTTWSHGPLHVALPDPATANAMAMGLAGAAVLLLFVFRLGILPTLAVCAALAALSPYLALT